jgi:hypothetical protein
MWSKDQLEKFKNPVNITELIIIAQNSEIHNRSSTKNFEDRRIM